jgi:hypothetical protein
MSITQVAASNIGWRLAGYRGENKMIALQCTVLAVGISLFILGLLVLED